MAKSKKNIEKEIKKYYSKRTSEIFDSFLTSCVAGLITAILIALVLGHNPLEKYQKFGVVLFLWGLTFIVLFAIFMTLFWLSIIYVPRRKKLKLLYPNKKMKKRGNGLGLLGWIIIILMIPISGLLLYLRLFDTTFKFLVTMGLVVASIYSNRIEVTEKDYNKIEKVSKLCELKLSRYQTWSVLILSLGFGTLATGLILFKDNYAFVWVGLMMVIVSGIIDKFQVNPRYELLEKHYSKNNKDMIG